MDGRRKKMSKRFLKFEEKGKKRSKEKMFEFMKI